MTPPGIAAALTRRFGLEGQVALVTGASAGIGIGLARGLAQAGARVVVAARRLDAATEVAQQIAGFGGDALALPLDVDDEASIVEAFAEARRRCGRLDLVVNNAGIYPPNALLDTTAEAWDAVQRTNTRGTFLCLREAARQMQRAGRGGCILNISSIGGVRQSVFGRTAYNASKAAVNRLTMEAALELAPLKIRVNAILPGPISTEKLEAMDADGSPLRQQVEKMIPLGHWGSADDIAAAAIYLASPAGRFITGQALVVDGGALLV